MRRHLVVLLLAAPLAASAQTINLSGRAANEPVGIAVPNASVAGGEEPAAAAANPAAVGFVDDLALQYFHEARNRTGQAGDGAYLAVPLGALVPSLSMEWMRPREGGGTHFRKTRFGLALSPSQAFSLGVAANWFASPDRDLDRLWNLDAGLTLRPWRHLSLGASALGMIGRLGGQRLPIRYDFGVATRLLRDALTLSADLLTDDAGRDDVTARAAAFGVAVELDRGYALSFQLQVPVRSGAVGPQGATYGQLAVTFNGAHAGLTLGGASGGEADNTWLVGVRLSGERYRSGSPLAGRAADIDLGKALSRSRSIFGGDRDPYGALLARLAEVREDGAAALLVRIDDLPVGQGRTDELRRALLDVRARKPVVAYLTGGGMKEYWLASAATKVLVQPSTAIFPAGLTSATPFLRDGLSKLGVAFEVVAAGRYKSAPDPLVRTDMSEAQREATGAILDDVFERQVTGIAEARGLSEARVRELVDLGVFTSDAAVAAHLADGIAWPDELEKQVGAGLASSWDRSPPRAAQQWGARNAIALIRVEGTIASGKSRTEPLGSGGIAGAETIASLVKSAADDASVVAIVLRVDSPGGDGTASDLIWREVMEARRKGKPVVVSMGDLAASGGYLVAVAGDVVLAEPSTLTGSIGVFSVKPDFSGLLQKLGVNVVTLKRGAHADAMSATRAWTPEERKLAEGQIQAFYELFLGRVAAGRKLERSAVEGLAGGRVWTGAQALQRGLVDRLGTLEDALAVAAARAGYAPGDSLDVRAFEPPRPFLDLAGGLGASASAEAQLARALGALPGLRAAALLAELGPVLALPLEWLGAPGEPASITP
ncbi:MAG: signal peptide peptidase SppA [Anaeromyxobacteraceae bacterium]